jgi:photosystem II stability/assembly factor-like uncharacterized protein
MKKLLLMIMTLGSILNYSAQNWTLVNSPVTNDLNHVFFTDNNNGWIVGRQGKILRTTDGGSTWAEQNSGTTKDLNKIYMVNNTFGMAVGKEGTVVKYNGTSWSTVNIGFSQEMCGVFFMDENTGWISGNWGRIMMTTDGGSSWTIQVSNAMYSNKFNDLFMLSANEGWAVGSSGRVLKYNGTNWINVSNPASSSMSDLHSVSFANTTTGVMTGQSSGVYVYNGTSWSTQGTALSSNSYHVYSVHMVSPTLAFAATTPGFGGAGIILKYDGNTWSKDYEYTGMNSYLFQGVTTTPDGKVFAVGSGGLIMRKSAVSGVLDFNLQNRYSLYPVPFNDIITITAEQISPLSKIKIYNNEGKLVLEQQLNDATETNSISVGELPPGFYHWQIISNGVSYGGNIVKQ